MMTKSIFILAAFFLISFNAGAMGPTLTGNAIYPVCSTHDSRCAIFINGWLGGYHFGTMIVANELGAKSTRAYFCFPEKINIMQLANVFTKYLENNPKDRHQPASDLVFVSFLDAFPCK
jgi:hypothetical protein